MMMNRLSLESKIIQLITRLNKKFKVEKALLFGSTARGNRLSESDVDLIVISEDFKGISIPERHARIQREWSGEEEVQALAYTPEEFTQVSKRLTMREILSYAKDVSPNEAKNICPKCGEPGSIQNKTVRNRVGKPYIYQYFAHYKNGRIRWCYIGRPRSITS